MKDIRLWGILVLALAVRTVMLFSVFADVERAKTPDSEDYIHASNAWATHGEYVRMIVPFTTSTGLGGRRPRRVTEAVVVPEIFRTPGYPTLLAGVDRIVGSDVDPEAFFVFLIKGYIPPDPTCLKRVLSFQVLLDLHLVLLTFFLGRSLAGHGVGLLAALLQAISPLAAAASCRILSDSIFAFMLIAAVVLLLRHFRTGAWWSLLSAALMMGAACYVRPVGLAFSAVMMLVLVCRAKRVRRTAAFAVVVVACVAPWVARNAIVADYWGFSSFATDSMYWYSAAEIEARRQGVSVEEVRDQFRRDEGWYDFDTNVATQPGPSDAPCYLTPGCLARYRWDKARSIILAHPGQYASIHLKGDAAFWLPGATDALEVMGYTSGGKGTLDVLHREGLVAAARHYFGGNTTAMVLAGVMVGLLLVRYAGVVLCGPWRLRLRKMTAGGWLCLLLVLTACLLPGPANHPRFRVPVEPILSVAAAIGWLGLLEWRRRRRSSDKAVRRDAWDKDKAV